MKRDIDLNEENIDIQNYGKPGRIMIQLIGIDIEGFEILSHNLSGYIEQNQIKTFTDTRVFHSAEFLKIREWKIKNITLR